QQQQQQQHQLPQRAPVIQQHPIVTLASGQQIHDAQQLQAAAQNFAGLSPAQQALIRRMQQQQQQQQQQ
ncbi:hypothetical protein PENTCL1PPCAC_29210, partial [Pristionchus entomophagus]